jgi:hypothetical protein
MAGALSELCLCQRTGDFDEINVRSLGFDFIARVRHQFAIAVVLTIVELPACVNSGHTSFARQSSYGRVMALYLL